MKVSELKSIIECYSDDEVVLVKTNNTLCEINDTNVLLPNDEPFKYPNGGLILNINNQ